MRSYLLGMMAVLPLPLGTAFEIRIVRQGPQVMGVVGAEEVEESIFRIC